MEQGQSLEISTLGTKMANTHHQSSEWAALQISTKLKRKTCLCVNLLTIKFLGLKENSEIYCLFEESVRNKLQSILGKQITKENFINRSTNQLSSTLKDVKMIDYFEDNKRENEWFNFLNKRYWYSHSIA